MGTKQKTGHIRPNLDGNQPLTSTTQAFIGSKAQEDTSVTQSPGKSPKPLPFQDISSAVHCPPAFFSQQMQAEPVFIHTEMKPTNQSGIWLREGPEQTSHRKAHH